MAAKKPSLATPLLLVAGAVLLGLVIAYFQHRAPLKVETADTGRQQAAAPAAQPSPEPEPARPSAGAETPSQEQAPASTAQGPPVRTGAGDPEPQASPEEPKPVDIALERGAKLERPLVTDAPERVRSARLGRTVEIMASRPDGEQPAEGAPEATPDAAKDKAQPQPASPRPETARQETPGTDPARQATAAQQTEERAARDRQAADASRAIPGNAPAEQAARAATAVKADQTAAPGKADQVEKAEKASHSAPADKAAGSGGVGRILSVQIKEAPGEIVLVVLTSVPAEKATAFQAKTPARLALDLWGEWKPPGFKNSPLQSGLFERLRTGEHPGKLRLVLDYRDKDLTSLPEPRVEKTPEAVLVRIPRPVPAPAAP